MTMDFYAYWNAAQIADLLRALAGIMSSPGYTTFLLVAAVFGFLLTAAAAAIRYRPFEIISWFFACVLLYLTCFAPKVTITVQDVRAMSAQTVSGVPLGVGFTAAASSAVGHYLAELYETAFSDVEGVRFTRFGAVFPERAAAAVAAAGPVSGEARAVLTPFIDRCVSPEVLESDAKLAELTASPNLTATVTAPGWTNPARFVMIAGAPVYCDEAARRVADVLTRVEVPAQERLLVAKFTEGEAQASAVFEAALRKAIPESASKMLGISQTLSESLSHAVLLAEIPAGLDRAAARMELPVAGAVAVAKAQGALASEISFRTMGELAAAFLPKLRNLLEFVLIAAFPVVMAMLVACGASGAAVARMYLTLFLWLALWAPIAAVMNHLLITLDAHPMNQLAAHYGGLTLEAADLIRDQGATSQAMAGYMMLLVPLISYLIAKASDMGAVSLASQMMQPAGAAAQSQSAQLSAGNVSAGNASIGTSTVNTASANKSDVSEGFVAGSVSRSTTAHGTVVRDASSGFVTGISVQTSDLGVSAASTLTEGRSTGATAQSTASRVAQTGITQAETAGRSDATQSALVSGSAVQRTAAESSGRMVSAADSGAFTEGSAERHGTTFNAGAGLTENLGVATQAGLHIGVGQSDDLMPAAVPGAAASPAMLFGDAAAGAESTLAQGVFTPGTGFGPKGSGLAPAAPLAGATAGSASGASSGGLVPYGAGIPGGAAGGAGTFGGGRGGTGGPLAPGGILIPNGSAGGVGSGAGMGSGSVLPEAGVHLGGGFKTTTGVDQRESIAETVAQSSGKSWETRRTDESRSSVAVTDEAAKSDRTSLESRSTAATTRGEELRRTDGTTRSAAENFQRTEDRRSGTQLGAGARLDSWLLHRAVSSYGSPEAALEALADPAERAAFARESFRSASESSLTPLFGHDPDTRRLNQHVGPTDPANPDAHFDAAAGRLIESGRRAQAREAAAGERELERAASANTVPVPDSLEAVRAEGPGGRTGSDRSVLEASCGAALIAAAIWRDERITMRGLVGTAFLAGAGVASPDALQKTLLAKSAADPELLEALREAGRRNEASPDLVARVRSL